MLRTKAFAALMTTACLAVPLASADMQPVTSPMTYGFARVTNNSSLNLSEQLRVIVADAGTGLVSFTFTNTGFIQSAICDIYFDEGSFAENEPLAPLASIASLEYGHGVSFAAGATPKDLPGGKAVQFHTTANLSADSDAPVAPNGINPGEWLTTTFNLAAGSDFSGVISSLRNGLYGGSPSLRIGLHVQSIGPDGQSDSYIDSYELVNYGILVPVPGAAILAAMGLGLVALVKRRAA